MPESADPIAAPPTDGTQTASPLRVRLAADGDAADIARIHNQGIEERSATFETEPRRPDQVALRLSDTGQPVMVAERDCVVVGWASVTRENSRCTQAGVGEYTIYVDRTARGGGIGVPLLEALVEEAERRGYWKLVGRIFTTNESSLALARRCGFSEIGIHRRHGCLDGEWKDVVLVERLMGPAAHS